MPALGGNGLAMRTSMFSQAAEQTGDVLVMAVEIDAGRAGEDHPFRPDTRVIRVDEGVDTRLLLITRSLPIESRPGLLAAYGKPLTSMALSAAAIARISEQLTAFDPDLVILSRAQMLPLVDALQDKLQHARLLVDLDDDDGALCRSRAAYERDAGFTDKAAWLDAQADIYDAVINRHADAVELFTVASRDVVRSIEQRLAISKIGLVPNGISSATPEPAAKQREAGTPTSAPVLMFVGNLSYGPNVDGMCWFLEEVWPILQNRITGLNLIVAGSNPGEHLTGLCRQDGVQLIVSPPDLVPLYESADAVIIPLRFGSGSRIKILEAGAHDVPVVSTFAGAEGLDLRPGTHAILSDETADTFAGACLECLQNRDAARARSAALQEFVRQHHDRQQIVAGLRRTLQTTVAD